MKAIVKLDNLVCGYKNGFTVKNICMEICKGSIYGLIGPNGSGKTTIIRAASASLPICSGKIEIENCPISSIKRSELAKKIAFVLQESSSPFDMTVLEYVMLGRIPHRKGLSFTNSAHDIEIAMSMLEKTGSARFADRFLNELSGGERQLVHIARALVQEPSILFLDEPTNHLDLSHQHRVMILINRLAKENEIAIVVVLHDLNIASMFCDLLYLVSNGEIVAKGKAADVLKPEIIENIYGTKISLLNDPLSGKPLIFTQNKLDS